MACAITNIDLEHTAYLGDTLGKIAFEKAGIFKPGVPAVVSEVRPEPRDVILARAAVLGCPISLRDRDFRFGTEGPTHALRFSYASDLLELKDVSLGLAGTYQAENAATAVALACALRERFPRLDRAAIQAGLEGARWPCRMERVLSNPPVVIDVAHNAAGARRLAEQLERAVVVLAVSSDKNAAEMIATLAPVASDLILTRFEGMRALDLDDLRSRRGQLPPSTRGVSSRRHRRGDWLGG